MNVNRDPLHGFINQYMYLSDLITQIKSFSTSACGYTSVIVNNHIRDVHEINKVIIHHLLLI